MPIYEYQCDTCGRTTEVLQKFSDSPLSECPSCGGPMHKLMSMNSFQLKGSGWYVTDYAGKNSAQKASKEAPAKESPCASAGEGGACKSCPSAAASPAKSE